MRRIEYPLLRILDPVLSILGIGRSSWGVLAGNAARRSAATQAAQDIWQDLETQQAIPPRVTLSTLEELSLPESKRKAVINQLAGNRLQGYICLLYTSRSSSTKSSTWRATGSLTRMTVSHLSLYALVRSDMREAALTVSPAAVKLHLRLAPMFPTTATPLLSLIHI